MKNNNEKPCFTGEQETLGRLVFFNSFSNAVIFIGPFKISTDHYHAVVVSALCACVYKQDGFAH